MTDLRLARSIVLGALAHAALGGIYSTYTAYRTYSSYRTKEQWLAAVGLGVVGLSVLTAGPVVCQHSTCNLSPSRQESGLQQEVWTSGDAMGVTIAECDGGSATIALGEWLLGPINCKHGNYASCSLIGYTKCQAGPMRRRRAASCRTIRPTAPTTPRQRRRLHRVGHAATTRTAFSLPLLCCEVSSSHSAN